MSTDAIPASAPSTPPPEPLKEKTYSILSKDNKPFTAKAASLAWTENGEFILLMNGDVTKHVIVAANVIAVTEA